MQRPRDRWTLRLLALPALVAACATDPASEARVDAAAVAANPYMVVAARVSVRGMGDSVAVRFRAAGVTADSTTPFVLLDGDSAVVPVLGLLPSTAYALRAVVLGGADSAVSESLAFTTGALPANLPSYTAGPVGGGTPSAGYVVFSAGNFGLVIDNTGRVVWYREFPPSGPGLNFMAPGNGRYAGRPAAATPGTPAPWVEVDHTGELTRSFGCVNGRTMRFHDLLVHPDGSYWTMCDETRVMDLTSVGGVAAASVTATVVQHVSAGGVLLFEWNSFDHFAITDVAPANYVGTANVNFTHGNSLDLDTDGHLVVSFRTLSEVTKVNSTTGAIMWRMGGLRNQFAFTGGPNPGFDRQHNVRVTGPGRFMVLDNVGGPDSRYERYLVDTGTMTATLEQSYGSTPGVTTSIGGSVFKVSSDRYLVSFGTQGRVEEFDAAGTTHWRINGNPGYVFRAQRIASLYAPGVGTGR